MEEVADEGVENRDYARVEQAIRYIEEHFDEQPDLAEVASRSGLSPFHFQRMFRKLTGISPKKFLQYTTLRHAKALLEQQTSVLDATLAVGLSSPSRLHDLFVTYEAITPGGYKNRGENLVIRYGVCPSPFGQALVATTPQGICELDFINAGREEAVLACFHDIWGNATLIEDTAVAADIVRRLFDDAADGKPLSLHLWGTNFQLKVWRALLNIPAGQVVSYQNIAAAIGDAKAVRAVGTAVGRNPVAYLVPCHRVLRKGGGIGGYATGTPRKRAMLAYEALLHGGPSEE